MRHRKKLIIVLRNGIYYQGKNIILYEDFEHIFNTLYYELLF
jgi:hypothetical protein